MEWEPVIGLEVHVQLLTQSKLFSGAPTQFGAKPNTQACAIDLALPGVLPVFNQAAADFAIKFGLSIQAKIEKFSSFARKNYFYPDLPKGYQISQHTAPIISRGALKIELPNGQEKSIDITRAHLEEDAGKSLHDELKGSSCIDLNRAGTPLLEIVSEPQMHSSTEASTYLKSLRQLVRYLEISDANMQEGSFRCDINISLRQKGTKTLGTRVEIKNVNSFRFVEQAIEYEIDRQSHLLEKLEPITQETRQYDANKQLTRPMRVKEEAHDYRYFPDPDLLPIRINPEWIESIKETLPELPWEKRKRFIKDYGLSQYDANFLSNDQQTAQYFEQTLNAAGSTSPKNVVNWMMSDLTAALNKTNQLIHLSPVTPDSLGTLLKRVTDHIISNNIAKQVFKIMWDTQQSVDEIIKKENLHVVTDVVTLSGIIDDILKKNPNQVAEYRHGKEKLFGYFVGQVMKITKGKASPQKINQLLKEKLQAV